MRDVVDERCVRELKWDESVFICEEKLGWCVVYVGGVCCYLGRCGFLRWKGEDFVVKGGIEVIVLLVER